MSGEGKEPRVSIVRDYYLYQIEQGQDSVQLGGSVPKAGYFALVEGQY
jgi:hypothetical protein